MQSKYWNVFERHNFRLSFPLTFSISVVLAGCVVVYLSWLKKKKKSFKSLKRVIV